MIAKKLLIAFVALAAALPLSNINAAAAGSATSPLYGPYVLTGKMVCGAGSSSPNGMGGLSTSNAAFSVDTADSYQTWLSARSLPNPAGQTHYNSLGFNSSATVPETPVQWGRMDKFGIGSIKSWGFNPGAPNPWVDQGPNFFLVTSYPFPVAADTYSSGYLLYLYYPFAGQAASWHQFSLAVNNPGSIATFVSAVNTPLAFSPPQCAVQSEWHK
jgi:hypothetical protein